MAPLLSQRLDRRRLCTGSAALLISKTRLFSQTAPLYGSSRPDVAAIDHDRILVAATHALTEPPAPLPTMPCPRNPGSPQDFFSEATAPNAKTPPFIAHRDAILALNRRIGALAAAWHLTHDPRYPQHAVAHLRAWFLDPATRMSPSLAHAETIPGAPPNIFGGNFEGVLDGVFLAEITQAIPFLATSDALTRNDLAALQSWFAQYLDWLTTSRLAGLARDQKDHHGTSWLLQAAGCARLTRNDSALSDLRHRFQRITLRQQIDLQGAFQHEVTTPYPYRYSLFNLDLLAGVCQLLSTQFESLWDFELIDGVGPRSAMARHYPFIRSRHTWPYPADLDHFDDLPVRNPALLFAARAYARPEYADLWKTLPPEPTVPALQRTFPIWQPLLWIARPRP